MCRNFQNKVTYKGLDTRKALDFSTATIEVKSNAFKMVKKIYFNLEFISFQAISQVKR